MSLSCINLFVFFFVGMLVFTNITHSKITLNNLVQFFQATYDVDKNGYATLEEFTNYFKKMEPEHDIQTEDVQQIFRFFDSNRDGSIKISQLVELAKLKITTKPGHKQIHIGLTQNQNQMQIMWVSNPESYNKPIVKYGKLLTKLDSTVEAKISTYHVGHFAFIGKIYRAVLPNLQPLKRYYYKVGDEETQTFSDVKYFKAPPQKNQPLDEVNIAVFGDMGTFAPFGHFVAKQISLNNFAKPFDFVFLTGDIAYAGMNSQQKGQFEPIWDLFGQITEGFAAYTPFMPGVGNHQKYYNYSSYMARYRLPRQEQNQTNLWFSFDYGPVHMVHFSSQHPYSNGSHQYDFLEKDLKKARENPNIKWIIVGTHRAFYSSDTCEYHPITQLTYELEQLMNKYDVDIVQNGHLHCYQRTWPVYQGKAYKQNHNQTFYVNPQTPIYVVQGTAGALIKQKWVQPHPEWSLRRVLMFGYGRITIKGNHLKYQFISLPVGKVVDTWNIVKDPDAVKTKKKIIQTQK